MKKSTLLLTLLLLSASFAFSQQYKVTDVWESDNTEPRRILFVKTTDKKPKEYAIGVSYIADSTNLSTKVNRINYITALFWADKVQVKGDILYYKKYKYKVFGIIPKGKKEN
jgi:hypothetical protein